MPSLGRTILAALALTLGLAVPANATLLVRSDGAGLLVQDKNGLNDEIFIGQPGSEFEVHNVNVLDAFKFEFQTGCREHDETFTAAVCTRVRPQINVVLASGNDQLRMAGTPQFRGPLAGNASVNAGSGDDAVVGHPGRDTVVGFDGADRLEGVAGGDTLEGRDGNDIVNGGLGADTLRGEPGADTVIAREPSGSGVNDAIGCGGGFDFLDADLEDTVPASCEEVEQGAVGETPNVRMPKRLRVSSDGRVRVRLRCPRGTGGIGCKGRLRLRAPGGRTRRVRYSIRAGRGKTVRLRLNARAVRRLHSRQRRGRRTRGVSPAPSADARGARRPCAGRCCGCAAEHACPPGRAGGHRHRAHRSCDCRGIDLCCLQQDDREPRDH